jgi:DNA mismatch endonuclease, patch repair protein
MDVHSPEQRRFNMRRIRGRDTAPEMLVRRALHARGFRYRLHDKRLPGKPDLVFPKYHAAILIHGCFWHGHNCHLFKWPVTRREFWQEKIQRNKERDERSARALHLLGWRTLVIWECKIKGSNKQPREVLIDHCVQFLVK